MIAEMRARAGAFAQEWATETREHAERQSFWNDWFHVFGINRRRRGVVFEQNVKKLKGTTGQIDVFWPGQILVEHKSAGADLDIAMQQAHGYLHGLADEELPRLIVLSDFARFRVRNLDANPPIDLEPDEVGPPLTHLRECSEGEIALLDALVVWGGGEVGATDVVAG